jgi:DNA sulfur modification protein DndB
MFDRLNTAQDSPLMGRLSPSASVVGKVSRVTFNRAVGPILAATVLADVDRDQRYKLVQNYIAAIEAELSERKLLVRANFFEAVFHVFDEAVRSTIALHRNAKTESIRSVIRPMLQVDFQESGGGLKTKAEIAAAMQAALWKSIAISDEML